jgi:hypothetical protein
VKLLNDQSNFAVVFLVRCPFAQPCQNCVKQSHRVMLIPRLDLARSSLVTEEFFTCAGCVVTGLKMPVNLIKLVLSLPFSFHMQIVCDSELRNSVVTQ